MWLLIPSSDRPAARRLAARVDQILGYPRQLAESEILRTGPAARGVPADRIRTETQADVLVHADGAIAIHLGSVAEAMRERRFEVSADGVKRRLREIIDARGWAVRDSLSGERGAWSSVPPRDGAEGSTTGEPIPEGQE